MDPQVGLLAGWQLLVRIAVGLWSVGLVLYLLLIALIMVLVA